MPTRVLHKTVDVDVQLYTTVWFYLIAGKYSIPEKLVFQFLGVRKMIAKESDIIKEIL